jgi:ATP-binding cassette, subfamily B, bacterial
VTADVAVFRRVLGQARPCWPHAGTLLLLGLLSGPLALLAPLPLKIAVDSVIGSHPLPPPLAPVVPDAVSRSPSALLALAIGLLLAHALLGQLQGRASARLGVHLRERLVVDFRARLSRHVRRRSLACPDAKDSSDPSYRIQHDAPAVPYILTGSLIPLVCATVTIIGLIFVIARIDGPLALIALAIWPGLVAASRAFPRRRRRPSPAVTKLTTAAGAAAVLLVGIHDVRSGLITLGELLLVMGYMKELYGPLRTITRKATGLRPQLARAARAFALLDEPSDVDERPNARPLARARGAIAFHRVSFAYGGDRPVLHDVSFDLQPGVRLGIVGASGAGKSTLISLLTRVHDPTAGHIRLDGIDLRDIRLEDLRRQFAVVPQDPVLLPASIADNIACARPGAGPRELIAAAQAADAHEFIVRLPQGYVTLVGEHGFPLTHGQRRSIAIARAFLKDGPVLLLDEPTSALDAEAEAVVPAAIRRLMRGRTVILITHRASLLERCTEILALENGRAVTDAARTPAAVKPTDGPTVARARPSLASHPAVHAWCQLYPHAEPRGITPVRVRRRKTKVYRLEGAGRAGAAVIAKQCLKPSARIERTVYEEILPRLTLPSLHCYGFLEEPDTDYSWLFLEEATGTEYSGLLAAHRAQAGRWLGLLHTSAADAGAAARLPDGGPGRYRELLRSTREAILARLDNPVLGPGDLLLLDRLVARLAEVDAHWTRLEEICEGVPQTLVHGDFNGKNLRIRSLNGKTSVAVFDWADAGWGVPAVDLAQMAVPATKLSANPDLSTYCSTVSERWPGVNPAAVPRLAHCGTVFRALAALSWASNSLGHDWASTAVADMRIYEAEMAHSLDVLDGTAQGRAAPDAGRRHDPTRPAGQEVGGE